MKAVRSRRRLPTTAGAASPPVVTRRRAAATAKPTTRTAGGPSCGAIRPARPISPRATEEGSMADATDRRRALRAPDPPFPPVWMDEEPPAAALVAVLADAEEFATPRQ